MVECIAPGTPEHQGVSEGLNQINAVLAGINSVKEAQENFQALRSYSERIQDFPVPDLPTLLKRLGRRRLKLLELELFQFTLAQSHPRFFVAGSVFYKKALFVVLILY